jgi:phospholipase/carboxylesterase
LSGLLAHVELAPSRSSRGLAIVLHGRGVTKEDLVDLAALLVDDGFVGVLPDGPIPGGAGRAWYESETRSRDLPIARSLLASLARSAQERHGIGREGTVFVGFSQGGVASLDVALHHPELVGRAACLSGHLAVAESPSGKIAPAPRVFLAHGTQDPLIPVSRARESRDALVARGIEVRYEEYPIAHEVSPREVAALREWLAACRLTPPPGLPRE